MALMAPTTGPYKFDDRPALRGHIAQTPISWALQLRRAVERRRAATLGDPRGLAVTLSACGTRPKAGLCGLCLPWYGECPATPSTQEGDRKVPLG